jgi:hypothetical protein
MIDTIHTTIIVNYHKRHIALTGIWQHYRSALRDGNKTRAIEGIPVHSSSRETKRKLNFRAVILILFFCIRLSIYCFYYVQFSNRIRLKEGCNYDPCSQKIKRQTGPNCPWTS